MTTAIVSDADRALHLLHLWRKGGSLSQLDRPEVAEFWDTMEKAVRAASDPFAAVECISTTISANFTRIEIARIAESLGAEIVEVDPANKPASLKDTEVHGWYHAEPAPRIVFPAGQDPAERLAAARQIASGLAVTQ